MSEIIWLRRTHGLTFGAFTVGKIYPFTRRGGDIYETSSDKGRTYVTTIRNGKLTKNAKVFWEVVNGGT